MSLLKLFTTVSEIVSIGTIIFKAIEKIKKFVTIRNYGFWNIKEIDVQNKNTSRYIEIVINKKLENQLQTGYFTYSSNANLLDIFRLPFVTKKIFPGIKTLKVMNNREHNMKTEILGISISINNVLFLINLNTDKLFSKRIVKFKYQTDHRGFVF